MLKTDDFIGLSQAALLTGKSEITIRRLFAKDESKSFVKTENGKLLIQLAYLKEKYPFVISDDISMITHDINSLVEDNKVISNDIRQKEEVNNEFINRLIIEKDKRIEGLEREVNTYKTTIQNLDRSLQSHEKTIAELIERDRESNIIIQSLQDKFTKQLQPPQAAQDKKEAKTPLLDKVLIGVAVLSSLALLAFLAMMLWAYLNR